MLRRLGLAALYSLPLIVVCSLLARADGPTPAIGIYWLDSTDPTAGAGMVAPLNQLLFRTDAPSIYYKSGTANTAWTKLGGAANGATIVPTTCTPGTSVTALATTGAGSCSLWTTPATITPAALGGVVNDYNPAGLSTAYVLRQDAGVHSFITGLAAQADGQSLLIANIATANVITIQNENAGSLPANRFTNFPQGRDWDLNPGDSMRFQYSAALSRWISTGIQTSFSLGAITQLQINGFVLPTALPANPTVTDDWNPPGLQITTMIHVVTNTAGSTLGGIVAPTLADPTSEGRILILENHGDGSGSYGTSGLTLVNRSAGSGINNKFVLPNLENLTIPYTGSVIFNYDNGAPGWIALGIAVGGYFQRFNAAELALNAPITPAILPAGNTNNFAPGSFSTYVRLNGANNPTLTGLVHDTTGDAVNNAPIVIIENVAGSITLSNEDANSTAANRFNLPFGTFQILAGQSVALIYDTQGGGTLNAARWRVLSLPMQTKWTMATEITPATLANADNPNYNPSGFAATSMLRLVSGGASTTISGMVAQEDGAIRTITCYGGPIKLLHQQLSTIANQFYLPNAKQAGGLTLNTGDSLQARYDALFGAWFIIAEAQ